MNKYFIYTGNAYPHKNLKRLVEAIKKLNENKKEIIQLKIISGRSVFFDRLQLEIKKINAEKYIEVLGFNSDNELKRLYQNSIAFVFPTLDEGFGLPPMEAINAGTLAVISDIPVLKEVYQLSVFYFDPKDIGSIVKALEIVLGLAKNDRNEKIKYAQEFVKKYSWSKMAEETIKVYNQAYGI